MGFPELQKYDGVAIRIFDVKRYEKLTSLITDNTLEIIFYSTV